MVIVIAYIVVAYIVDTKIILIIVNTVQVHPEEGSPCRASFVGDESEKQSRLGSIKAVILDTYIILIYVMIFLLKRRLCIKIDFLIIVRCLIFMIMKVTKLFK